MKRIVFIITLLYLATISLSGYSQSSTPIGTVEYMVCDLDIIDEIRDLFNTECNDQSTEGVVACTACKVKAANELIYGIIKDTCNCRQEDIRIKNLLGVLRNDECVLYFNYTAVAVEELSNVAFENSVIYSSSIVVYNQAGQVVATASDEFAINTLKAGIYFAKTAEGSITFIVK